MSQYQKMYALLFHEVTKAIESLQLAQQRTEALYMDHGDGDPPRLTLLRPHEGDGEQ